MQVSEGLKRATGRGEQVQHHLGTLDFDGPSSFPWPPPRFRDSMLLVCLAPKARRFLLKKQSQVLQNSTSPQVRTTIG
jgi:hypothetical protein